MKKLILLSTILLLLVSRLYADDYYWVGGTGNWSETTHWASVSGGTPNKSIVPGSGDDVYFDANSGLAAGMTVTLPTGAHAYCRNMSWAGVTTAAIFRNNVTTYQLQVSGNVELSSTVRYAMSNLNFVGNSNATYKTNGAARLGVGYYNPITVSKGTGSLTFLDGINENTAISNIVLYTGLLNMSGQTHTIGSLSAGGTTVRSVDISNATITCTNNWVTLGSNLTLTATNSTITADMFHSLGLTFDKVTATRNDPSMDINNNTFNELTLASLTSQIGTQRIGANNIIGRLEFKSGGRIAGAGNVIGQLILAPGKGYIFHGNNTINTSMLANTADCDALGELRGADANARLTFGAGATADIRNVLITSLTAAGSIAPINVVGVDGGSNTGFNITPRTGGNATLYWVGGAGDWDDRAHWSTSSGGPGGACVPFTTDDVVFDANSDFTNASKTVSVTSTARCHNMTWTNVANSPILNIGSYTMEIWGSVELDPTMTFTGTNTQTVKGSYLMKGAEASTFTSKGCKLGSPLIYVDKTGPNGGLTISDDLVFPLAYLWILNGKLLMPGRTVNIDEFRSNVTTARTIDYSNATITVNNWIIDSRNATSVNNGAGSFITAKVWFSVNGGGVGFTYPKVYSEATVNSVNITGSTIGELVFTNTSPTTSVIALNGNGGNTIGTLDVRCGRVVIQGNNTINNLLLAPSRTYYFKGTQTITGLFRFNSPDCNGLGELRDLDGTPAILSFGPSSTRDFNNVYLLNMTATGSGVPISVSGADAGGNTGFNITPSAAGPRYWVGGSGDWNESAHWSTTSGGPGGACVPTVANDVYFDASSFTSGSSTVTISQGNAYCRNMDWTGATFAPVFNKASNSLILEIWGNLTLNNVVTINAQLYVVGSTNSTLTSNGAALGNMDIFVGKPAGYSLRFMDNFSNPQTRIDVRNGGLDLSGRTIALDAISDGNQNGPTTMNITNATLNIAAWEYTGGNKSLQAAGSIINASGYLKVDDAAYNIIHTGAGAQNSIGVASISAKELIFTNPSTTSAAFIYGGNTIGKLEFKGKGYIAGTGNTLDTLIFSPGKAYTFLNGSNTTITKEWFGSGTPCNLTEITSLTAAPFTVTKAGGEVVFDYVRLRNITAAGITPFKALEHSENLGGNTNWDIAPYNGSTPILGLGPDKTLCANEFPYTLNTDGFFASPQATIIWNDGSTGKTLVVNGPGTYSVTVSYPDGCSRPDNIVITRSTVTVDPVTGTAAVCEGKTTTFASTTPGGVWSTSDAAVATVSATGVVTGVTAGTANIIYTVTNGDGCSNSQQLAVTVNAVTAVPAITGTLTLFQGGTTTLSNTTPGGVWSSGNTAVATVDAGGVVTGVAGGTAIITYTVTNPSGCVSSQTVTVTVDGFSPDKRVLSVTKTADAQEPVTDGGFSIHLPAGVLATENITIPYTVSGTASPTADYTPLSGTAVIIAGNNSVSIPVSIVNDVQIETTETVILTLQPGTSTNYTYTVDGAAGNATVQIADDDDVPANRLLSVTAALNVNEPANTGTFTIALPSGVLAPENITVTYAMSGTSTNGIDYQALSGTAIIPAGQNSIVVNVTGIDDQLIEQTEDIIMTISGGTTPTAGNFGVDAVNFNATLYQADNDYTAATRLLAVASNGNLSEPTSSGGFTIKLPGSYQSSLPITVTYTLTGTATHGADYSGPATTITLPANANSVNVPVSVVNDDLIEPTETIILTIVSGVATQGASAVFTLTPDPAAPNATINITDEDNIPANKTITVTALGNAAEPSTSGAFRVSLPPGVRASEDITVTYAIGTGTANPGTDYTAITGSIIIPANNNSVDVPVKVIDNTVIEPTETVILNVSGGTSANLSYTAAAVNSATVDITDNDAIPGNTTVVLLTKISDAIEGSTHGQYRISLPPGVTSSEDITVTFSTGGIAQNPADYTLQGLSGGNIVIPAGDNEVLIDVNAINDALIEGPENVVLTLLTAGSPSQPYTIDPAGNGATVNIADANAASSTPLQVIAGTNAAEPGTNATFTIKLAGVATSAYPITVAYKVSNPTAGVPGATSGLDYESFGTIVIPPGAPGSVTVTLNVKDDNIIEPTEPLTFTLLSGSATDGGGNAYIFPPDPVYDDIIITIADNDATAANQVLKVEKVNDAAEPNTPGSFKVSLPPGITSSANLTLNYTMDAASTATRNTDYSIFTITLPAYQNSVSLPVSVIDDKIIESTETATLNLVGGTDGNFFTYTANPASNTANLDITDDDNTADNRKLSVVTTTHATEGNATPGRFTIKLPAGITTSTAITVNYAIGGSAASPADYPALTGTATILAGSSQVNVDVPVTDDNVIEQTETVTLTITGGTDGTNTFTPATGSATASLNITDNDDIAANKILRIVRTAHAAEPLTNGGFRIEFEAGAGITSSEDITVNYTIATGATAATNGTDYTTLSGSVVLPAGNNGVPVAILVKDDQMIESITEVVTLTITGGTSASYTFIPSATATSRTTSLNITDDDNIAANKQLILTKTADAAEPATNGNFRISLPPGVTCQVPITVNYSVGGSTAIATPTANADYTGLLNIIIPAGSNYVDIPVKVIDDSRIEQTETVVLLPNGTNTAGLVGGPIWTFPSGAVTVNILDDDNTPANRHVNVTMAYEGTEGGAGQLGRIRFNFSLPTGIIPSENVTISYTVTGTATLGTDFTGTPTASQFSGTAQITSTGMGGTASVGTVVDDDIIEGTEDVVITITSVTSPNFTYTFGPAATALILDNDNAPANLELSVTKTADAVESGAVGKFTISLPGTTTTSTEDITVNYTITGTAVNGTDYTNLSGTTVIPANSHSVDVDVTASTDQILEGLETVILTITGGQSTSFTFTPAAANSATVDITDADNTPANLTLSISKVSDAKEGSNPGNVKFSLPTNIVAAQDITVNYTVSGGTATSDVDYPALSGTAIIKAGDDGVTIPVPVIDDQIIEPLETVIITLTGGNGGSLTYTGAGDVTVNIEDNDNTPDNLQLKVIKDADATEQGTPGNFIVSLPDGVTSTEDITVNYIISGTATATDDYGALIGSVVITAGNSTANVPVTAVNDLVIEGTETVILEITDGTQTSGITFVPGPDKTASLDIIDDDQDPVNLVLNIAQDLDAAESGTSGRFIISLPFGVTSSEDITVNYTVSGGTATPGSDYTALSGSAIIKAGDNSVEVSVDPLDDNTIEPTETVIATLAGGSSTNLTFTGTNSATVNITDDESAVPANLELTVTKVSDATEGGSNGSFMISLPGTVRAANDITVNYLITGTATPGSDYTLLSGTAVILAGQPGVSVPVTVQNDDLLEAIETVILTLNGGTGAGITYTGTGNAIVNITDDENTPANLVLNVAANGDVSEAGSGAGFIISLPNNIKTATDLTVSYTVTGTAINGTDYVNLNGTAVIPAGDNSVPIQITGNDDQVIEGNETIVLTIGNGATTTGIVVTPGANSTATINLIDDDNNLDIVVSATPTVAEPSTAGKFTISLAGGKAPAKDVTVRYTITGTATTNTDYTALSSTAVIPAGSTSVDVNLTVLEDELIEPTETVIMTIDGGSSTGLTYTVGAPNTATINITDNDATGNLVLEVTASKPNADEVGNHGEFTISIANGKRTAEPVTLQYTISGTATSNADYQSITGTITIPANANSITVPVQVINDLLVEDPETVILTISGGQSTSFTYTAGAASQATVTITSEDIPAGDLTITKELVAPAAGPYRIGQEITYRITVSNIGNGLASGVVVTDTLALQLGLPSSTIAGRGTVSVAANRIVNWTIGDVIPGESVQLEIRVRIIEGGELVAGSEVGSGSIDPDMTNNKASFRLQIEGQDLNFPNVFSPNGDGKNEKFIIGGIEKYPGAKLQVFNRWGSQVYRSNDYRNDWNGSDLNEGTYFYILEVNKPDGMKSYKGWVFIVR